MPIDHRHGGIDVHAHVVPLDFPARLASSLTDAWPGVQRGCGCHATVFMGASKYREIDDRSWDGARRQADMDMLGLRMQALSPMPELLSYWLPKEDGAYLCRFLNEQIAALVAQRPERFAGLGAVPLQHVDTAIGELHHAVSTLGLHGVEVGSNIDGVSIGHERFRPFFEAAQALGAAVFVHPLRPAGKERLLGPPILEQILAFPSEIGLAGAAMITGGTLAAYPRLRLCLSHGGGTLVSVLPRLQQAWKILEPVRKHIADSPTELARRMYYDLCVFDADLARDLVRSFGDDRLVLGTDYPYPLREEDPVAFASTITTDVDARERLLWRNAERFLGL
ncbi:MAG: amidohydrolase family protein [Pseudomonadota bacterium]